MDFLSQAATAAKTKVALVNAVGFLMASKHTYLHYAPFLPFFSTCSVFKIAVGKAVLDFQYYIYFYVTKPTQMLINELSVDCLSVACTSVGCSIGLVALCLMGFIAKIFSVRNSSFQGTALVFHPNLALMSFFNLTFDGGKRMYCRIEHL